MRVSRTETRANSAATKKPLITINMATATHWSNKSPCISFPSIAFATLGSAPAYLRNQPSFACVSGDKDGRKDASHAATVMPGTESAWSAGYFLFFGELIQRPVRRGRYPVAARKNRRTWIWISLVALVIVAAAAVAL